MHLVHSEGLGDCTVVCKLRSSSSVMMQWTGVGRRLQYEGVARSATAEDLPRVLLLVKVLAILLAPPIELFSRVLPCTYLLLFQTTMFLLRAEYAFVFKIQKSR